MAKAFSKAEAEEFFARLKKHTPEPKTELQYVNPYTLLVAVVMMKWFLFLRHCFSN